jgi:hypothetical protein
MGNAMSANEIRDCVGRAGVDGRRGESVVTNRGDCGGGAGLVVVTDQDLLEKVPSHPDATKRRPHSARTDQQNSHVLERTPADTESMPILHIEHPITDLDTWLATFARFAPAREQGGVIDAQVLQPVDDPHYIVVNLRFASTSAAQGFLAFLQDNVWSSPAASPALAGKPSARVLTEVALTDS